jgi:predicted nucleotidyltransferase
MSDQIVSSREKEILKGITEILQRHLAPRQIILFGSRGKGKSHKGSDFDFAVDQDRPPTNKERAIFDEIEQAAGLYDVDIVYLNEVDVVFKELIVKIGKVIYARRD